MQKEVVKKTNINNNTITNNNNVIKNNNNVIKNNKNNIKNKNTIKNNNNIISKNKTCRAHKPFEKNVELLFKKQNIDFESTNYNLSKELLKDVKKAVNNKGIEPTDDYYAYINDRWLNNKFDDENYKYIVQYRRGDELF